jgi:hypothetical protein
MRWLVPRWEITRISGVDLTLGGAAFAVSVGVAWLDLTSFEQYLWFSFVGASRQRSAAYLV